VGKLRLKGPFSHVHLQWFADAPPAYASGNIDNAIRNLGNTVNTPVTGWNKASHFVVAIALEAVTAGEIANTNCRLEWRNKTDSGAWAALGGTGQLVHGLTDLVEGNPLEPGEAICVPVNGTVYVAGAPNGGTEKEGAAAFTVGDGTTTDQWSEFQVSVDPANALSGKEYEFRVYDVDNAVALGPSPATLTVAFRESGTGDTIMKVSGSGDSKIA